MLKKENFEKDLMNQIDRNHQINITIDYSVSSNSLVKKSLLNVKSFKMFLKL